jgi:CheY-like chemotaxis protein
MQTEQPGIILLDLMMPEMDGFEFIRELRQHPQWRSLPVIVLTAKDLTIEERLWLDGQTQRIYQKGTSNRQLLLNEIHNLLFDVVAYRQQLEAAYDVSVAEILPFSEEMMHLASSEIFSVRYPNHPFAKAVDAIGKQIVERREIPCR